MKRTAFLLTLVITFLPSISLAGYTIYQDDRPIEFMQSLLIGSKTVALYIPGSYQMVDHELNQHQHKLGFVYDTESKDNWSHYVSLNIVTNTPESASMRIKTIQSQYRHEYKDIKVLDVDIQRKYSGLQNARVTLVYQDEIGEVVVSALYYSDSASLVGVEVSQRVKNSVSSAQRIAEKTAKASVRLSDT